MMTREERNELLDLLEPWAFVETGNPEWPLMWSQVPEPAYQCPESGEVWQYMGSHRKGDGFEHEFRHRCFRGGARKVVHVRASERLMESLLSIAKELRRPRPEAEVLAELEEVEEANQ